MKDGSIVRFALECDEGGQVRYRVLGESTDQFYGENDALSDVAVGKADKVIVVKVLAIAERSAKFQGRK